jgi:hypothetical protein
LYTLKNNPAQMSNLFSVLPAMIADINALGSSLSGLQAIQSKVTVTGGDMSSGDAMFGTLLSLKPFQPDIAKADAA